MVNIRRGAGTAQNVGTSGGAANDFTGYWEDTILTMDATSGTVQLQCSQVAAAGATVFQAESWMTVTRVA
jgi:cephalosporin-C deacetylase-like acetyl esterase